MVGRLLWIDTSRGGHAASAKVARRPARHRDQPGRFAIPAAAGTIAVKGFWVDAEADLDDTVRRACGFVAGCRSRGWCWRARVRPSGRGCENSGRPRCSKASPLFVVARDGGGGRKAAVATAGTADVAHGRTCERRYWTSTTATSKPGLALPGGAVRKEVDAAAKADACTTSGTSSARHLPT